MDISLTKMPWYAQIGIFVVLAIGASGAFYKYYELPQRAAMIGREKQLKGLRADVTKGRATASKLQEFQAEVESLEGRLDILRAVLPEEKDAAELLRQMQIVAVQSNLTIKSFKPSPIVTKELHAEWPISLQLDGTYHNLAHFFNSVGKFTRIVNISGLAVKGLPKTKTDSASTISATCVATTFVLLDKPMTPVPVKGAKGAAGKKGAGGKKADAAKKGA
jgi:type IV pilus assembly protein PilO